MRKKILFIITKSNWGGAQRYVFDLATHLPTRRYEAVVAAGGEGVLFQKLQSAGIRTIPIPTFRRDIYIGKEFRSFFNLVRILREEKPAVVHLSSSKAGGIGAAAAWIYKFMPGASYPLVVFTAHGWGFNEPRQYLARIAIRALSALAGIFQDSVICINAADAKSASRLIRKKKIVLIPNGIGSFTPLARNDARRKLSQIGAREIAPAEFLIGTIAELTKNKGHEYLLDALALVRARGVRTRAIWIGEGELRDALEKKIRARGLEKTIFLAGFLDDARKYLPAFDVFVLPSLKEGTPYTILEAMHAGVPVIAARAGGIPDLLQDNKTGILVRPADTKELAAAIERASQDAALLESLAKNARTVVQRNYTLERMLWATEKIYESLTG
ncbi:MAG: Second mannosyl transferase [candidate division Kazan bacterium GW2011_GWB1_52_7]|uniref:Second mannosyl transferase n=1 Tax=candidate division Kazan bacterium GW2011_GWB1_52_7 TaxID=1620414 RepID=A0A0G1ZEW4_UNCK3|nr:MAG: Second mannosyl transferase [candidate division Kazan bacterium GW2011_GWB1_52_7]